MRSVKERFTEKTSIAMTGCWNWTGATDGRYGSMAVNGRQTKAHRISWTLTHGDIPDGMFVLHRCDNTLCVNPGHLFIGTQSDNLLDCSRKGRSGAKTQPHRLARGNANGARKHPDRLARGERNGAVKAMRATDKCRRGHLFTRLDSDGHRACQTCRTMKSRERRNAER